jgi:hypothetical protein
MMVSGAARENVREGGLNSRVERGHRGSVMHRARGGHRRGLGLLQASVRRKELDRWCGSAGGRWLAGLPTGFRRVCVRIRERGSQEGLGVCVGLAVGHAGQWLWEKKWGGVPDETDADSQMAADARMARRRTAILG